MRTATPFLPVLLIVIAAQLLVAVWDSRGAYL